MKRTSKSARKETARELLALNLRVLRAERALTKEELASLAGIDRGYIGQIESKTRAVSINIIDKLAIALDVPVARLFMDHENRIEVA